MYLPKNSTHFAGALLVLLCLFCRNVSGEPSQEVTTLLNGVRKTCYRCHGEPREERTRVEGDFDLTSLLEKNELSVGDSATWLRVLNEVTSERMPPEEGREELSDAGRNYINRILASTLNSRNLSPRMLTSPEIDYDHSLIYNYDRNLYSPFSTLKLQKLSNSRYRTIDSENLISSEFLISYQNTLEKLIDDYTQNSHEINNKKRAIGEPALVAIRDTDTAFPLDKLDKGTSHFEMRSWGWQSMVFKANHPRAGIPPGKYRITFKARALDRHRIAEKKAELESTGSKGQKGLTKLMDEWRPLLYSKARISLHGEVDYSHRKRKVLQTITEFEIEDNEEKTYSYDFTLGTGGWIYINFINGPANGGKWRVMRFGTELVGRDPSYPYPRVEVRDMHITQIGDAETRNNYDIAYLPEGEFNHELALKKVQQYASELGVPGDARLAKTLFEQLPPSFDLRSKYAEILKLLSLSNAYLFLDSNGSEAEAARFASYALLKRKPTKEFQQNFHAFRAGKLSSEGFAHSILKAPEFDWFLEQFVRGWFLEDIDLDNEKYSQRKRELDVSHEPVDFLKYLFTQNRPIPEVFYSNYSVADAVVAPFYGIEGARFGEAKVHEGTPGGILRQVAFLKSQSDGIDGLPFRRAEWVIENVFDQRMGNPPNNVNNDEFVAAVELKTFRERTEFHSKQRGCMECHNAIDPVAFAFQHKDTLGELIGTPEPGFIQQFQQSLNNSETQQVRAFATQLIQYVVGRRTTVYDAKVIEKFLSSHSEEGYRTQPLLAHILDHYFK